MIKECCVCGKREREGLWSREFFADDHGRVSHGYCPICFDELMGRLDQLFLTRHCTKKFAVALTVSR